MGKGGPVRGGPGGEGRPGRARAARGRRAKRAKIAKSGQRGQGGQGGPGGARAGQGGRILAKPPEKRLGVNEVREICSLEAPRAPGSALLRGAQTGSARQGEGGGLGYFHFSGTSTGPEENLLRYRAGRGCYRPHGCGEAGKRIGSLCAIKIEALKRRPPTEVGGLSLEFRAWDLGFRLQGLGFRVQGLEFRVYRAWG